MFLKWLSALDSLFWGDLGGNYVDIISIKDFNLWHSRAEIIVRQQTSKISYPQPDFRFFPTPPVWLYLFVWYPCYLEYL